MTPEGSETSAALAAYRAIKQRIVDLEYGLGEKLSEARLVTDLGFGRSPIRSAVARLRSEGWIAVSPQSGTYVKALTNRDIEEVTELRILLEMRCARAAALNIDKQALKVLRASFKARGPRASRGDSQTFIELDTALHDAIYRAAGNGLISGILVDLRDKVQWIRRACAVSLERVHDGFAELEEILCALEARDPELTAERLRAHISNAAAFCRTVDLAEAPRFRSNG